MCYCVNGDNVEALMHSTKTNAFAQQQKLSLY